MTIFVETYIPPENRTIPPTKTEQAFPDPMPRIAKAFYLHIN